MYVFHFILWQSLSAAPETTGQSQIDSLKSVSSESDYFPFAQYRLATLYLGQNTVASRKAAEQAARLAVKLAPHNPDYRLVLCRILLQQGFYIALNKSCDALLEEAGAPGFYLAEAYYYKGLIKERSALKYRNMVAPVGDGYSLSLSEYGIADLREAARCFEMALRHDAKHRDALFHLGSVYYEVEGYTPMRELYGRILATNIHDKDALVFAALAEYHLFRPDTSESLYKKAFKEMSRPERDQFSDVRFLQSSDGTKKQPTEAELDRYWQTKDPLLLTRANERRLEHYNRVAYANLRFGIPSQKIDGWNTERGMIYIRYGRPEQIIRVQPDEKYLGGREIWVYADKEFTFEDYFASGQFQMDNASLLAAESAFYDNPDGFSFPTDKIMPLSARPYQFKGNSGSTIIRTYYAATAPRTVIGTAPETTMDVGFFVMDASGRVVQEQKTADRFPLRSILDESMEGRIQLDSIAGPQTIGYSIEVQTRDEHLVGFKRDSLIVKSFKGADLLMSNIVLSDRDAGSDGLLPNLTDVFRIQRQLHLQFEIYNLKLSPGALFRIESGLQRRARKGLIGSIADLFSDKASGGASSTSEVSGRSSDEKYSLTLDISDAAPGNYDLLVRITDLHSGQTTSTQLPVTIK